MAPKTRPSPLFFSYITHTHCTPSITQRSRRAGKSGIFLFTCSPATAVRICQSFVVPKSTTYLATSETLCWLFDLSKYVVFTILKILLIIQIEGTYSTNMWCTTKLNVDAIWKDLAKFNSKVDFVESRCIKSCSFYEGGMAVNE